MDADDGGGDLRSATEGQSDASSNAVASYRMFTSEHPTKHWPEPTKVATSDAGTNASLLPNEAVDAFNSLTSFSRPLLMRMNEVFLQDPKFRDVVRSYIDPPKYTPKPCAPFPYMDLPTEIRLRISEYALCHEETLLWHWTSPKANEPNTPAGGFRRNRSRTILSNALGLACRQLYQETKDIVFKVNDLMFGPYNTTHQQTMGLHNVLDAYKYFIENSTPGVLASCNTITFKLSCDWLIDAPNLLDQLSTLVQTTPNIKIRCLQIGWMLRWHQVEPENEVRNFMRQGRSLEQTFPGLRSPFLVRALRIHPAASTSGNLKNYAKYLSQADIEVVRGWLKCGIEFKLQESEVDVDLTMPSTS